MDLETAGKRVVVTGGTRGIGKSAALEFASRGARVLVTYRADTDSAAIMEKELAAFGAGHRVVQVDSTSVAGVAALVGRVESHLGGIDVLVNNAGVDGNRPFIELDDKEWHRVLDANLTGMYRVTRALLFLLDDGASVVNVGAAIAARGGEGRAHHTAAKAAVQGFTRSLAKELGPRGVRVNTLAPGVVPGVKMPLPVVDRLAQLTALGRLADAADIAGVIVFLGSRWASYVSGATIVADGGI